jgi:hypothetical protein
VACHAIGPIRKAGKADVVVSAQGMAKQGAIIKGLADLIADCMPFAERSMSSQDRL